MSKIFPAIIFSLIITVSLFLLSRSSCNRGNSDSSRIIDSLTLANQRLDSLVNIQGQMIFEQEAIVTESKEAIVDLTDSIFKLKNKHDRQIKQVIAYYKGTTQTHLDSVFIPYTDTLLQRKFEDSIRQKCQEVLKYVSDSFILVPRKVKHETPYYHFTGTVKKEGLEINHLSFPDTLQLRFITKKGGFLKKPTYQVQFFHSNPHVTQTGSNSVIYKPPRKPRLLEKALLIGAGLFIGTKL